MKQKDILVILIPSFLITLLWVIFSIYHNFVTTTIKDPLTYQILPINGTFNTEGINMIKDRKNFEPVYTLQGTPGISPTPTVLEEVTPTPEEEIISESPEISASPSEAPTPTDEVFQDEGE